MKLLGILSASVLVAAIVGCETGPRHVAMTEPNIRVEPSHRTVMVGETDPLIAHTMDIANSGAVQWKVSPNTAKITANSKSGQSATFSADQAGTYIINAMVQAPDGSWITSRDTTITVNGHMSNDK